MISHEGLVVDFWEHQSKDSKSVELKMSCEEVALRNGSPSWDVMGDGNLLDLSFGTFVSFNKFLGLPVDGFENKIVSLLMKMEAKKGCRVATFEQEEDAFLCLLF